MATDYKNQYELLMVKVIDHHPFFSHVLSQFKIETRLDAPYAAGVWSKNQVVNMYINPELFFEYKSDVQCGIWQHEVWHIILNHQDRKYMRDHELFNVACDLAINKNIVLEEFLPEKGCFYDKEPFLKFKLPAKLAAEEYYKLIIENPDLKKEVSNMLGKGTIIIIDDHGVWTAEGDDEGLNEELIKEMVKKAVEKCGGIGNVPGNVAYIVNDILKPAKVPWQSIIRSFVNKNVKGSREQTWSRQSKRLPGLVKGKKKALIPKLLCGVDSSGSISNEQLDAFMNELRHVQKRVPVRIIVFDCAIHDEYEFTGKFNEIKARGGTDFRPFFERSLKIPDVSAIVVLTDGYGPFPTDTKYPQTLWVITKDGDANVPFGRTVQIDI